jgi:FMN phosphatase YigB (HAD superfamily)
MNLRAAIFDIYKTILEVGAPPADAEGRWIALCHELLEGAPRLGLAGFGADCERIVAREHAAARRLGIAWPEIYWPDVVLEVLPELAPLTPARRAEFMFRQVGLWHTVRLMPGAGETLRTLKQRGILLGIASNAQPYTLRELGEALAGAGLDGELFAPDLCFWSFLHGFSKPDPHVFRLLAARLSARGVAPADTLMIGDRNDNDIEPARAQGWQTWRLTTRPHADRAAAGGWAELAAYLDDERGNRDEREATPRSSNG